MQRSFVALFVFAAAMGPLLARAQAEGTSLASPTTATQQVPAAPQAAGTSLGPDANAALPHAAPTDAAPTIAAPAPTVLARAINLPAQQKMPESFGAPGQWLLGGSSAFNIYGQHRQQGSYRANALALDFSPWVAVFAARHFAVGATLPISYARGSNIWFASVGAGPMLAWHIPLADRIGLLPRASVAYYFSRSERTGIQTIHESVDAHSIFVNVRMDAVAHLSHHLSAALGPYASWSVLNRAGGQKMPWETFYGLHAGLIGWF